MSTRNRGASGASADLSPQRLVEDVTAYATSVGEPVGLAGFEETLVAMDEAAAGDRAEPGLGSWATSP